MTVNLKEESQIKTRNPQRCALNHDPRQAKYPKERQFFKSIHPRTDAAELVKVTAFDA
jgi:hypothetical protein